MTRTEVLDWLRKYQANMKNSPAKSTLALVVRRFDEAEDDWGAKPQALPKEKRLDGVFDVIALGERQVWHEGKCHKIIPKRMVDRVSSKPWGSWPDRPVQP